MKPHPSFKPQVDAEAIRKAVGGFGKCFIILAKAGCAYTPLCKSFLVNAKFEVTMDNLHYGLIFYLGNSRQKKTKFPEKTF